jgi:hypothetical protein
MSKVRYQMFGHKNMSRARICKCLKRPEIDSQDSIPPAYVAWRAGTSNRIVAPARQGWESIPGLLKRFTNTGSVFPVKNSVTCFRSPVLCIPQPRAKLTAASRPLLLPGRDLEFMCPYKFYIGTDQSESIATLPPFSPIES